MRLGIWEVQLHGFILSITIRLSSVGVMVGVEAVITILAVASQQESTGNVLELLPSVAEFFLFMQLGSPHSTLRLL